jgi:hypothetical protein
MEIPIKGIVHACHRTCSQASHCPSQYRKCFKNAATHGFLCIRELEGFEARISEARTSEARTSEARTSEARTSDQTIAKHVRVELLLLLSPQQICAVAALPLHSSGCSSDAPQTYVETTA